MVADAELRNTTQPYEQRIHVANEDVDLTVLRIEDLQGRKQGEGDVHRVNLVSTNQDLNGVVCVEKKIHPNRLSITEVMPINQLAKFNAIKQNGGIVPAWMYLSIDQLSLYTEDITKQGKIRLIDVTKYKHRVPQLEPDPEWVSTRHMLFIDALATNLAASVKSNLVMVPDSMFMLDDISRPLVIGDFGQGIKRIEEFGGGDIIHMNMQGTHGLLSKWGSTFEELRKLITERI